jgi:hypothetical protein
MMLRPAIPACVAVLGLVAPLAAQPSNLPAGAKKVDPGVGDVNSLGVGRVDLRKDLRRDSQFGSVYKFTQPTPYGQPGQTTTTFFRVDGGLTAAFPQSIYTDTASGPIPLVPPGTTYYIGTLPDPWSRPAGPGPETGAERVRSPHYVDLRVDTSVPDPRQPAPTAHHPAPAPPSPSPAPPAQVQSLWTDEAYRAMVVGGLLDRAAQRNETP